MIRLHHVLLAGALLAVAAAPSQAAFSGSIGLSGLNPTQSPGDLATSTAFANSGVIVTSNGTTTGTSGFAGLMAGTPFTSAGIDLGTANGYGFLLSNPLWGTFTATAGVVENNNRPQSLTLLLTGDYVGGTNTETFGVVSTFRALITFTQVQGTDGPGALVQQISLEVPTIPEPSSVALGAIGLVSMSLVALRKRRAK